MSLLAVGLLALAAGLGWFLVVVVAMAWATVALAGLSRGRRDVTPSEITSLSSRAMRFRLADVSTEALGELWAASGRELTATYLPSTVVAYAAFAAPARGPGDSTRMPRWPRAR